MEFRPGESRSVIEERLATAAPGARLRMVFLETPANPTNDLIDIEMCVEIARAHATGERGPIVAVDNTFLGPIWQSPLRLGADLILYSLTKFVGGHSDLFSLLFIGIICYLQKGCFNFILGHADMTGSHLFIIKK